MLVFHYLLTYVNQTGRHKSSLGDRREKPVKHINNEGLNHESHNFMTDEFWVTSK